MTAEFVLPGGARKQSPGGLGYLGQDLMGRSYPRSSGLGQMGPGQEQLRSGVGASQGLWIL